MVRQAGADVTREKARIIGSEAKPSIAHLICCLGSSDGGVANLVVIETRHKGAHMERLPPERASGEDGN